MIRQRQTSGANSGNPFGANQVSITEKGAVGDGVTDDTGAIEAAISDLTAVGGGRLIIPKGTFRTTSEILLPTEYFWSVEALHRGLSIIQADHNGNVFRCEPSDDLDPLDDFLDLNIQNLGFDLPGTSTGTGLIVRGNGAWLDNLRFSGGSASSWMMDIDRVNQGRFGNIKMGGAGAKALTGNGLKWTNSDKTLFPFNFGDASLDDVYIQLSANNTTGIYYEGPEYDAWAQSTTYAVGDLAYDTATGELYTCDTAHTSAGSGTFANDRTANPSYWSLTGANKINFVSMKQVQVTADPSSLTGTVGVHIKNSARIHGYTVDTEGLETDVILEGEINNGALAESNLFVGQIALSGNAQPLTENGTVTKTAYFGCDNFPGTNQAAGLTDGDTIFPRNVYLTDANGNANVLLTNVSGNLKLSDGADTGSLTFTISGNSPQIAPTQTNTNFFLAATGTGLVWPTPMKQLLHGTQTSSATYNVAVSDQYVGVDSSSNAVQVNLRATPTAEQVIVVADEADAAGTNNITISGNGNTIMGNATLVLTGDGQAVALRWDSSQSDWRII